MIIVFGGCGHAQLDDCWALDCQTLTWRQILATGDKPEKIMGHASAAMGSRLFIFGGQVGRNLLKKLFVLDISSQTWTKPMLNDSCPSARSGHAMATSNGDLWLFGGQGKKLTNDLYRIDVSRGQVTFHEVTAEVSNASKPSPRKGHSLTHDPILNALILFGGTTATGADQALWSFDIERGQWIQPKTSGPTPSARTNHSAALISKHHFLFWGGCSTNGVFYSDSFILDTRQWQFHKPQLLNSAPAQRYHHTCVSADVEGKAILYGGINHKQTFGSVVVVEHRVMADLAPALNLIAEGLQNLARSSIASGSSRGGGQSGGIVLTPENYPSLGRQTQGQQAQPSSSNVASAAGICRESGGQGAMPSRETSSAMMNLQDSTLRTQLTDLLVKRDLQEMHSRASRRLDDLDSEVEALKRELSAVRLLKDGAEEEAKKAMESCRKMEAKVGKEVAAASALRARLQDSEAMLRESERGRESGDRRIVELSKELGILTSRLSKLQGEGQDASKRGEETFTSNNTKGFEGVGEEGVGQRDEAESLFALLSAADKRCESLTSEVGALSRDKEGLRERVMRLEGDTDAIRSLGLDELRELAGKLEASSRSVRAAVLVEERIEREVQLRLERAKSTSSSPAPTQEQNLCSICLERGKEVVFQCGHQACLSCGGGVEACPFCRATITARIKLFNV